MPKIQHKRGTASSLSEVNPTPAAGEIVFVSDENAIKIGTGSTAWTSLAYVTATPRSHKSTHATGGSDALTPSDIGAAPAASPTFTGTATFEGVILADDSTSTSAPVYSFTGDTNCGLAHPAADTCSIVTAGSERLRVDSAGRCGIGNSSMASFNANFDDLVVGSGGAQAGITLFSTTQGTIAFGDTATNTVDGYRGYVSYLHADDALIFGSSAAERIRVNSSGNVGIGTNSPASRLDVNGVITVSAGSAAAPALVFSGDSNTGIAQLGGADTWSVVTAGVERLRVRSDGNVGIGVAGYANAVLAVQSSLSSASTRYGTFVHPEISAASTSTTYLVGCQGSLAASAAPTDVVWFGVLAPTVGSGASITTATGLLIPNGFTTGTTVYGVRSRIPDAANRWNIFVDGTAANYFAGNVGIGASRTTPATALDVNGVITVTGGSASAPALCISGDSNTGIFQASGAADSISITTNSTERLRIKSTGAIRFVPLTADPGTADAGDVYYNSSTNKLRVYNGTSWVDLH